MELVIGVVAAVLALIAVVLVLRRASPSDEVASLRNDVNLLREKTQSSMETISNVFTQQLKNLTDGVQTSLATVNEHLANRLGENARTVNDSMANVQHTFAGLQKQVGEMSEQARQLAEMSRSLAALERVLSTPKQRGGFGEAQLENLLVQVFAREQFQMQYAFPSGDVADAVLFFPQGKVAIDSKFPLENFRRMAEAETEADKKAARREFLKDTRKRIDEIASKYVRPGDGTLPFALMYVPAENVYYEAIIRNEDANDLYSYGVQRRVVPVSPNSLYAYLQTILVGLNGMRVSQRAEAILRDIESLRIELGKFSDNYTTVGKHLKNAADRFEEGSRTLGKMESRVEALAGRTEEQLELGIEERRALGAGGS
jgi:DNA recombination protein RmuC